MTTSLDRLIGIGGQALGLAADVNLVTDESMLGGDLRDLLGRKNGFYAFESALHVLPARSCGGEIGLTEWNSPGLWIEAYKGMASGCVFFAEDVFGGQFCIKSNKICSFDPETGALQDVAEDMEGWARSILADYDFMTGYSLCHEWQRVNGRLNSGLRLVPKVPFVAGGKFNVQNLHVIEAVKGMRLRGQIALQIKDIPDGEQIKLKIVE